MQTHETKQSSLVGNELGMSKVLNDQVLKQDSSLYKKQVTRNQMSILTLGVYLPTDPTLIS